MNEEPNEQGKEGTHGYTLIWRKERTNGWTKNKM